ncbi:hypothetical protein QK309_27260, partial [Klebsiella quasipneumoniae]|nr:hypothetical protein [Klebsiella quasipneumoniae]
QASNKAESSVERLSFLFLRLKRTPSRKVLGFLLCGVYFPDGAVLTGATDLAGSVARTGTPHHHR